MADVSDVQNVLAGLIASTLYPNGTSNNVSPAVGFSVRVGTGWPTAALLDSDLKAGIANITAYGIEPTRNTTRYQERWQVTQQYAPTITLASSGPVITIGGTLPATYFVQNLAVFIANEAYTYSVQPTDTLQSIATALAAIIAVAWPGTVASGQTITLPAGAALDVLRVGGTGTGVAVVRNQQQTFQITAWCSTSAQRNAISNAIDPMLSDTRFLVMPDGLYARIKFVSAPQQDLGEKARLFRRDFKYSVDYATTKVTNAPQVIVGQSVLTPNAGPSITSES